MAYPGTHTEVPAMPPAHGHIVAIPSLEVFFSRQLLEITGGEHEAEPTNLDMDQLNYHMHTGFCQIFWGFSEGQPRELGKPILMEIKDETCDFNSIKTGTDEYVRENPGCVRD
jgi:hypothetical protein